MKHIKLMNEYLASLYIEVAKIHNLHWNVTGPNFKDVHLETEAIYERLFEEYDAIAERIKMIGEYPLVKVSEFVKIAFVKELESKDYKDSEVLKLLVDDLKIFKNKAFEIREYSENEKDFITVDMFEEFISKLDKDIWFISSMIK